MQDFYELYSEWLSSTSSAIRQYCEETPKIINALYDQTNAVQAYWTGLFKYIGDFMMPSWNSLNTYARTESEKIPDGAPSDTLTAYDDLAKFNSRLGREAFFSGLMSMNRFYIRRLNESLEAWLDVFFEQNASNIERVARRQKELTNMLVYEYPKAIEDIKTEYGFHFENGGYVKEAETDRFILYQVLPQNKKIKVRKDGKPILILPPYVLGANILAFLPDEQRSYVHCFANQGIPTYIRIIKDIDATPAVQEMTGEDDALDTRYFSERLKNKYGKMVTLNGFCQGGYHAVINILSGELDGLVDGLITCASPMDGSRSKSLVDYANNLPGRFRDLDYAAKILPNGNKVVDGEIMGWVYKLRRMDVDSPVVSYHRDLALFDNQKGPSMKISKTAAAVNYWTIYDRKDLPYEITKISFDAYHNPVSKDGTLPVKLFGRELNFNRIKEMEIPWLICIADKDDLVDREASLAALDFVDAEVTVFPKGHAAIATSWSIPASECALHLCFCISDRNSPDGCYQRGPVCFQLDLERELREAAGEKGRIGHVRMSELPMGCTNPAHMHKASGIAGKNGQTGRR